MMLLCNNKPIPVLVLCLSLTNISSFAYGFDVASAPQRDVRTYVEKTVGGAAMQRVEYGYDGVNQLTSEAVSQLGQGLSATQYAYDPMGNRSSVQSSSAGVPDGQVFIPPTASTSTTPSPAP